MSHASRARKQPNKCKVARTSAELRALAETLFVEEEEVGAGGQHVAALGRAAECARVGGGGGLRPARGRLQIADETGDQLRQVPNTCYTIK